MIYSQFFCWNFVDKYDLNNYFLIYVPKFKYFTNIVYLNVNFSYKKLIEIDMAQNGENANDRENQLRGLFNQFLEVFLNLDLLQTL